MSGEREFVVPCPVCDAGVGEACVDRGALGTPVGPSGWHIMRWNRVPEPIRARIHKLTVERVAEDLDVPEPAPREHLADRLAAIATELAELANDPGRTLGLLPGADSVHLEALSDHVELCSIAVRDRDPRPLSELSRKFW